VLGASFDPVAANKAFCDKFAYPFKLLSFDKAAGKIWGATDDKESDYAKRISYLIGPDRKVAKVYTKVKPADHPAQVLADVP
jgi:peroxiredoxin Q/BCP